MALQLVDIFGNLQPDTGPIATPKTSGAGLFLPYISSVFTDVKETIPIIFEIKPSGRDYVFAGTGNRSDQMLSWNDLVTNYSDERLQSLGFKNNNGVWEKAADNSGILFDKPAGKISKKFKVKVSKNSKYIKVAYESKDDILWNTFVNTEQTDIFKQTVGDKFKCLVEYDKLSSGIIYFLSKQFTNYFLAESFSIGGITKDNWEIIIIDNKNKIINYVKEIQDEIKKSIDSGKLKKEDVPSCFLPDPDPALPGPPTQTISGVTNKAPTVDDPNIKLPTQEVKSLTATSATDAVGQAQTQATSLTSQAQGAVSSVTGQAQGAVSSVTGQAQGAVSSVTGQAQGAINNLTPQVGPAIKVDGLGNDWTPDKFQPSSIAGNTKYVDPKTGIIGSTSTLAKGLTGAVAGGALGAGIGALAGGGTGALAGGIGGAVAGTGVAIGGVTGGALAGAGLGAGVASIAGGNTATIVGAGVGGAALGAAVAKLNNIKSTMPKPNVPKPPNTPRIKTVKIPRPNDTKGAQALLNLPKSPTL